MFNGAALLRPRLSGRFVLIGDNYKPEAGTLLVIEKLGSGAIGTVSTAPYELPDAEFQQVETRGLGTSLRWVEDIAVQNGDAEVMVRLSDSTLWQSRWGSLLVLSQYQDGYDISAGLRDEVMVVLTDFFDGPELVLDTEIVYRQNGEIKRAEGIIDDVPAALKQATELAKSLHREIIVRFDGEVTWNDEWGDLNPVPPTIDRPLLFRLAADSIAESEGVSRRA